MYGDPQVHPQPETYWGNVNPIGPRGVYDEAKRYAEAMTMAYLRQQGVDTAIVRIFNTFGPKMRPQDGRAIPTFLRQALSEKPVTVFGDGSQTRSFCYVDDLGLLPLEPTFVAAADDPERAGADVGIRANRQSADLIPAQPLDLERVHRDRHRRERAVAVVNVNRLAYGFKIFNFGAHAGLASCCIA